MPSATNPAVIESLSARITAVNRAMAALHKNAAFHDFTRVLALTQRYSFLNLPKDWVQPNPEVLKIGREAFEHFEKALRPQLDIFSSHKQWLETLAGRQRLAKICIEMGLFPHSTILEELAVDKRSSSSLAFDELHAKVWPSLRIQIEAEVETYRGEELDRSIMIEAISAHENELFNLIPAAIFAHIERAIKSVMKRVKRTGDPTDWFINQVGGLGISEIGGLQNLEIYKHLRDGAYISVYTLKAAQQIHFPNRNAVIHGVAERTYKIDSVNSILLGNFVFLALAAIEESIATGA